MKKVASWDFEIASAAQRLKGIKKVILVGSGKGGVGKSFVAASLALTLASIGHRTGIFDADLHGASQPKYMAVAPPLETTAAGLKPKIKMGVKVMSVALLTGELPVPIRSGKKGSLLGQMFALTDWGRLDYLVVDLPPSTGDELFSAFETFAEKSVLILVTTPSSLAIRVVARLARLARSERIPVLGVVVNMAYLRTGDRTTYPFGRPDLPSLKKSLGSKILVELPLEPRLSTETPARLLATKNELAAAFRRLAMYVEGFRG